MSGGKSVEEYRSIIIGLIEEGAINSSDAILWEDWPREVFHGMKEDDKKVLLRSCGYALRWFSDRDRDNKELVLLAMDENHWALSFASSRLRGRVEMWEYFMRMFGACDSASSEKKVLGVLREQLTWEERATKLSGVMSGHDLFSILPDRWKTSNKQKRLAVLRNIDNLYFLDKTWRNDKGLLLEVCKAGNHGYLNSAYLSKEVEVLWFADNPKEALETAILVEVATRQKGEISGCIDKVGLSVVPQKKKMKV